MASISRLSIIKFLELALACACLGLHHRVMTGDWNLDTFSAATFGGFIIILIGNGAGTVMGTSSNKKIDLYYSLVGCATFVAAGALNIKHFEEQWSSSSKDYGLAKGSLSVINGVFFLLDTLVTWRGDF